MAGANTGATQALLLPGCQLWVQEPVSFVPTAAQRLELLKVPLCLELLRPAPPWERLKNVAWPLQPGLHNHKSFVLGLSDLERRKR